MIDENIVVEVSKIIESRHDSINHFYPEIKEIYENPYDCPELDPLRHEICLVIMFGFTQASITLTNHFMESALKYSLKVKHAECKEVIGDTIINSLIKQYSESITIYDSMNLYDTIEQSLRKDLISDTQKEVLHEYRSKFRNSYSHASMNDILQNDKREITSFNLKDNSISSAGAEAVQLSTLLIGQGIFQAMRSENEALPYFISIDSLVRDILSKLFT